MELPETELPKPGDTTPKPNTIMPAEWYIGRGQFVYQSRPCTGVAPRPGRECSAQALLRVSEGGWLGLPPSFGTCDNPFTSQCDHCLAISIAAFLVCATLPNPNLFELGLLPFDVRARTHKLPKAVRPGLLDSSLWFAPHGPLDYDMFRPFLAN